MNKDKTITTADDNKDRAITVLSGETVNINTQDTKTLLVDVNNELTQLQYVINSGGKFLNVKDGREHSHERINRRIRLYENTNQKKCYTEGNIDAVLMGMLDTWEQDLFLKTRNDLAFDDTITDSKNIIDEVAHVITGDKYNSFYPQILENVIHSVKRKLFGLKVEYPLLVNLYGKGGAGKTDFWQKFTSPINDRYRKPASNAKELISDNRGASVFSDNYVIMLEEISTMKGDDVTFLKNLLDCGRVDFRIMRENSRSNPINNSTLLASSNTPLRQIIKTGGDIRKWAEIDFIKYATTDLQTANVWTPLNKINWIRLWQGIDENTESPLKHNYTDFTAWTEKNCRTISPIDELLNRYIYNFEGQGVSYSDILSKWKAYANSRGYPEKISNNDFTGYLMKYGFILHRTTSKRLWLVPMKENCPLYIEPEDIE